MKINRVMLTVKVIKTAEVRQVGQGQVAKLRCVQNTRRKNDATGQWEDVGTPLWVDVEVWATGRPNDWTFKTATEAQPQDQLYLEAEMRYEEWESKDGGGKRSKHSLKAHSVQFLEKKGGGEGGDGGPPARQPQSNSDDWGQGDDQQIPF